jgi:hypothetical protein
MHFTNHAISIVCWFLVQFVGCSDWNNAVTSSIIFWQVFEKAIRVCEQALEDPKGSCLHQLWHELIIRTNVARDLTMLVNVKCPEELAADRMTHLNKELKEFFEKEEGQKCRVTSLYTRVMYTYVYLT